MAVLIENDVRHSDSYRETAGVWLTDGERTEMLRILDAMLAAGVLEDGPGIEPSEEPKP